MSNNTQITYSPAGPRIKGEKGPFLITRLMLRELISSRELIWRFFVRDFSAKYRQSVLGIVWAILMPLIIVGMFIGMKRSAILSFEDVGIPYALYAIVGLTIWNFFTVGLVACTGSIVSAGSMIIKINFPKVALVFAASGQGIVEFIIRAILIAFIFIYYGIMPSWIGLLLGIICLIPVYLLTVGIGFILSLAAGVLRDIINVLNIALMGFMLLTPILYPIKEDSMLARANLWNPFNYLVNVPRDLIFRGTSEHVISFAWFSLFALIIFYIGWKLFFLAQTKIAERI
jgi:lipopolysaccharide transport system permease protein